MDFKNERLMISEEEARNRAKELLNENQVDLLTKYMFLEQQCKRQKEVIDNINQYIKDNSYKIEWGDELQDNESLNINDDLTDEEFIMGLLDILKEVSE